MLDNSNEQVSNISSDEKESKRKKLLIMLGSIITLVATASYAYWALYSSHYVATENAYTAVEIAQVTTSIEGNIKDITVSDTQTVKKRRYLS